MIVGVETGSVVPGNDAAGTAVFGSGCDDGVLAVEPLRLAGQNALAVLEGHAVAVVGKGSALVDQLQGVDSLRWQLRDTNRGQVAGCSGRGQPGIG